MNLGWVGRRFLSAGSGRLSSRPKQKHTGARRGVHRKPCWGFILLRRACSANLTRKTNARTFEQQWALFFLGDSLFDHDAQPVARSACDGSEYETRCA